jgi:NADH-quinone oxidoreductase subunit M
VQQALFLAFCLAFFVKLPIPPLHTWLPEAHAQTSTAGSFVLGAIVFQAGTYGLVRFAMPLFPDAVYWAAPAIGILSVIAIVYGAIIAVTQRDMKKMIAFSSVSHLGFITLGLFAINQVGVTGALVQSLAHSVTAGALFLLAGVLIDRYESRSVDDYGGLAAKMPVFAVLFVFLIMAYAGVPGLIGFVGEFLVLAATAGSWAFSLNPGNAHFGSLPTGPDTTALILAFVAGLRVVVGAIYLLGLTKRLMLGSITGSRFSKATDVTWAEAAPLLPLVLLSLWVGLQPGFFTSRMDASVKGLLSGLVEHSTLAKETAANMAAQQESVANWNRDGRSPEAWPLQRKQAAANGGAPAEGSAAQPGAAHQGGHP